jgi:hypothetical protein
VARVLAGGRRDEAEELAWVARRADHDDPLPLLVLISLLRGSVGAAELRFLEEDLDEYPTSLIEAARRRVRSSAELAPITALLDEPPESGERPAYLADYASKENFIGWARKLTAGGARRGAPR